VQHAAGLLQVRDCREPKRGRPHDYSHGRPRHSQIWGVVVLIYLFRDEATDNLALTVDVTGQNIPPITPSTDWFFVEAIDTLRFPAPWDLIDFQCLLRRLRTDGFYLFGADVKDPKNLPTGWARLLPQ
jgi:hypothetical protein